MPLPWIYRTGILIFAQANYLIQKKRKQFIYIYWQIGKAVVCVCESRVINLKRECEMGTPWPNPQGGSRAL